MTFRNDEKTNTIQLRFFQSVLQLKRVKRAGWISKVKVHNPESVADHTYSMCAISMVLSDILRVRHANGL